VEQEQSILFIEVCCTNSAFKKQIPEDAIASIIYESLLALEYLHTKAALIHRDIKAGNLLLTMGGKVKLADFGVSAQLKTIGGRANTFIGTPYWMAPEVIMCDPDNPASGNCAYTDKSDIWSIGITCIEIAEKNPPLSDIHPMQALTMIPKSEIGFAKPKTFSKLFVDFVTFLIVKNPDKRPSAMEALAHPFMTHAAELDRGKILTDIVTTAQKIKDKKKAGLDVTEEDEGDIGKPAKTTLTLKNAKNSIVQLAQSSISSGSTPTPSEQEPPPSISDFPTIVNNVQEGCKPVLEPVILTTLGEVLTADVLDGQYILIGNERGLSYLDLQNPSMKVPQPLLQDVRFRQIQILSEYNVLVTLAGKHDHIRQYNLSSIRKLILFAEGHAPALLAVTDTRAPIQKIEMGQKSVSEYEYLNHKNETDPDALVNTWSLDFIKIVNTRDTKSFSLEQTESTAYLCILGQGITLFRWAIDPYNKFMKIKSFWVPENPKFFSFAQDGLNAVDLFVGYSSELNRVAIHDSKVSEIRVHREMKTKSSSKARWQNMLQIPFTDSKLEQLLRENGKASQTTNRKLAAVTGPTLKRGQSMTDRYFLGTYHRLTKVVDEKGYPMIGTGVGGWKDGVMWSEPPIIQILRPLQHVMSCGRNNIEIVDWKSAILKQRLTVEEGSSFRFLCPKHGATLLVVDKKKKGSMLYWMRESSPPPRQSGSILSTVMNESEPVNLLETTRESLGNTSLQATPVKMTSPSSPTGHTPRSTDDMSPPIASPSDFVSRPAQGPLPEDLMPQIPSTSSSRVHLPTAAPVAGYAHSSHSTATSSYTQGGGYSNGNMSDGYNQNPASSQAASHAYRNTPSPQNGPPRMEYRQAPQQYQPRPSSPESNQKKGPVPERYPPTHIIPQHSTDQYVQRPPESIRYAQAPPPSQMYVDPRYQQSLQRAVNPNGRPISPPVFMSRPAGPRPTFISQNDPRYHDPRYNPDPRSVDPRMSQGRQVPGVDPRIRPDPRYQQSYDPYGTIDSLYSSYNGANSTVGRTDADPSEVNTVDPRQDRNYQQYDPRYQDPRYQDPRYQDPRYQQQDPRYQRTDPRQQRPPPERKYTQEEQRYYQGPPPPPK
jgi:hypothetical protein